MKQSEKKMTRGHDEISVTHVTFLVHLPPLIIIILFVIMIIKENISFKQSL